jgi:hypothetical protein
MLEPGGRVTLTQRFEGREETRVITGFLTEMRHDFDHGDAYYMRPGGSRIALGGPSIEEVTLTLRIDERGVETDEFRHQRAKKKAESKEQEVESRDYVFETVRDPRTKMITLYCHHVDSDTLFYDWDLNEHEVPKGEEPPVFAVMHEDIFNAMKKATAR